MNKKLKRKQALIMAEPYRTPFNSKVAKVNGDVIEDSVGGINKPTRSYDFKVNGFSNVVKSENLLKLDDVEPTTINGVTYSIKNGVIKFSGTAASNVTVNLKHNFPMPTGSYGLYTGSTSYFKIWNNTSGWLANKNVITTTSDDSYGNIVIFIDNGKVVDGVIETPTLTKGTTAPTKYKPYFDPYIESFADKKNLLGFDDLEETTTNGITYSIKNGVLKFKGTSTAPLNLFLKLKNRISKNTIVTSNLFGDKWTYSNNIYLAEAAYSYDKRTTFYTRDNLPITFTAEYDYEYLLIQLNDSNVDLTLKPILVKGKTAPTTFLPYQDKYSAFLNVKGKNLIEFDDVENATANNGITYSIKNGVITFSATPAETIRNMTFHFNAIGINVDDTYSIALFNQFTSPVGFFVQDKGNGEGNIYLGKNENIVKTWNVNAGSKYEAIVLYLDKNKTYTNEVIKPILVSGSTTPTEFEPYYSFTKKVLINQPLRKFDYLTYDGVYRQTNEIVLDGSWDVVDKDFLWEDGRFVLSKPKDFFPLIDNWEQPFSQLYITTTSNLPLLPLIELQYQKKKGIALNNGGMIIKLDDSADNSLNNWTVEKVNNYFKQNPITITYKTTTQTFEATSLTRLLFKNGYNKITAFDSINNNAIVEYLEYYKSK